MTLAITEKNFETESFSIFCSKAFDLQYTHLKCIFKTFIFQV
jgi:hypothetical protein